MSLFVNHTIIPSSPPSSPSVSDAGKKGMQIPPRTIRERRGVTSLFHIESYTLAGDNDGQGSVQPKGHLQPTAMNIPRRRRAPAQAVPIAYIFTPLSSPSTSSSPSVAHREGTQNHLRTPCEHTAEALHIHCNRAKIEEWRRGIILPEGQWCLWEVSTPDALVLTFLFSPCTPPSDTANADAGPLGRQCLPRTLRDRRGVTLFIQFEPRKLVGWPRQRGPQPVGHLEPTVDNLPRRHKREIYGPMVHSRLPCNFY